MSVVNKAMYAMGGMEFTMETRVRADFEAVVEAVVEALEANGMEIQADIDPGSKIRANVDDDFGEYRILGACALEFAAEALATDPRMGALMPCNVVVYEDGDDVVVRGLDTERVLPVTGNSELEHIAEEIHDRFSAVLAAVESEFPTVR
jgi:uncharacterized protein (DUF302 family)